MVFARVLHAWVEVHQELVVPQLVQVSAVPLALAFLAQVRELHQCSELLVA